VVLAVLMGTLGADSCCNGDSTPTTDSSESEKAASFLGPEDFEGSYEPREGDSEFGGEAKYQGRVVFLHLTRSTVAEVLPNALELAPNTSTELPEMHPVLLIFGHQTETRLVYPFWTPEVGEDYRELILIVPFVRKSGHQRWHNYVVRMYLEDFWATLLGNQHYGLKKIQANFAQTSTSFEVVLESISMFEFGATSSGARVDDDDAETTLLNYTQMKKIVGMPILGRLEDMIGKPFICSYFEWYLEDAEVRPIEGTAQFLQPFVTGMLSWQALGEIGSVADGAWELTGLRWRIGYPPFGCEW
jgi:hypothetical protein